jgi:hypothetical protein
MEEFNAACTDDSIMQNEKQKGIKENTNEKSN